MKFNNKFKAFPLLLSVFLLVSGSEARLTRRATRPRGGSPQLQLEVSDMDTVKSIMARYENSSPRSNRQLDSGKGKGYSSNGKGGKGYDGGSGKGGKGYYSSNGKGGKGKGGKGKGGKGSGSGSGWVDGEYYGCLALSEDEIYEMETHGHVVDCDYTIHAVETTNGTFVSSSVEYTEILSGTATPTMPPTMSPTVAPTGGPTAAPTDESGETGGDVQGEENGGEEQNNEEGNAEGGGEETNSEGSISFADSEILEVLDYVETSAYGEIDPYEAFDIKQCDTYDHLWAWDLTMSCGNSTDTWNCTCTYAEELMDNNLLSCSDIGDCPATGCDICYNCLKFLGCQDPLVTVSALAADSTMMAATIFSLLSIGGFCLIYGGKRESKKKRSKLGAHLMEDDSDANAAWTTSVVAGVPSENGTEKQAVWLVPDSNSVASASASETIASDSELSVPQQTMVGLRGVIKTLGGGLGKIKGKIMHPKHVGFPDLLGKGKASQSMPPNRIPTNPTDVSSHSGSESDTYGYTMQYEMSGLDPPMEPAKQSPRALLQQ